MAQHIMDVAYNPADHCCCVIRSPADASMFTGFLTSKHQRDKVQMGKKKESYWYLGCLCGSFFVVVFFIDEVSVNDVCSLFCSAMMSPLVSSTQSICLTHHSHEMHQRHGISCYGQLARS